VELVAVRDNFRSEGVVADATSVASVTIQTRSATRAFVAVPPPVSRYLVASTFVGPDGIDATRKIGRTRHAQRNDPSCFGARACTKLNEALSWDHCNRFL
jgi:hypothetical protein